MQEISSLTLVLTDRCNFSCAYCPQRKGKKTLKIEDIRTFMDFLQPRLAKEAWLGFYGGEPLLSWPLIEKTVAHLQKKSKNKYHFTLTTNGYLLKKEQILFLKKHSFEMVLSYDGLAQKQRDSGSVAAVEAALANLKRLYPEGYIVNSVFTPQTVSLLAESLEELLEQGHERLMYALDMSAPWNKANLAALEKQLERLAMICIEHQQKTGNMPLENFKTDGKKGVFACFAGRDRLALLPDRTVWGCEMFHTLLGHDPLNPDCAKYGFGRLEEFMSLPAKKLAAVTANYAKLRQDYFFSEKKELCSLCPDLEHCTLCPVVGALATGTLAVFPSSTCELKKTGRRAQARLVEAISRPGHH
jgi:sulfatase maturation enzyme AslB (radical SAM superfamily)